MPLSPLHAFCGSWAACSTETLLGLPSPDRTVRPPSSSSWTCQSRSLSQHAGLHKSMFSLSSRFGLLFLFLSFTCDCLRQGRVLRFWSLSHSSGNSSPSVLLWLLTELLSWSPHLLCWCSVFHQKLNMAKQRSALPLTLCCSLTSPFLLWQPCCPVPPGLPFHLSSAWNHPLNPINFSFIGSLEFVPASPVPLSPSKN